MGTGFRRIVTMRTSFGLKTNWGRLSDLLHRNPIDHRELLVNIRNIH